MSAVIMDGKACADFWIDQLSEHILNMKETENVVPHLAVILVGNNAASEIYVRNKQRACERAGVHSSVIRMPEEASKEDVLVKIRELNEDDSVHGVMVQLPLPSHISEDVVEAIDRSKDVDGLTTSSAGSYTLKLCNAIDGMIPCTPDGILYMLKYHGILVEGKQAVIIGRSNIVGKPMAMQLLHADATVTVCHSKTRNLAEMTRQADILVVAAGKPALIKADMVKPGAVVVDVGMNRGNGKLCGDVDFESVKEVAGYITPVPGGVGKTTVAALVSNTYHAALQATAKKES